MKLQIVFTIVFNLVCKLLIGQYNYTIDDALLCSQNWNSEDWLNNRITTLKNIKVIKVVSKGEEARNLKDTFMIYTQNFNPKGQLKLLENRDYINKNEGKRYTKNKTNYYYYSNGLIKSKVQNYYYAQPPKSKYDVTWIDNDSLKMSYEYVFENELIKNKYTKNNKGLPKEMEAFKYNQKNVVEYKKYYCAACITGGNQFTPACDSTKCLTDPNHIITHHFLKYSSNGNKMSEIIIGSDSIFVTYQYDTEKQSKIIYTYQKGYFGVEDKIVERELSHITINYNQIGLITEVVRKNHSKLVYHYNSDNTINNIEMFGLDYENNTYIKTQNYNFYYTYYTK